MIIFAIDPGDSDSGVVIYDTVNARPTAKDKLSNEAVLQRITEARHIGVEYVVVEKIQARGMPVGQDTMDTQWWAARFYERALASGLCAAWLYRTDVKMHLCGNNNAKDPNVRRALIDKWGPSEKEAKGSKSAPGPLYGFAGDMWAALAVARTFADTRLPKTPFHP